MSDEGRRRDSRYIAAIAYNAARRDATTIAVAPSTALPRAHYRVFTDNRVYSPVIHIIYIYDTLDRDVPTLCIRKRHGDDARRDPGCAVYVYARSIDRRARVVIW